MHAQNNTSLGLFSCKLKPISLIIFSLFAQVAYSQETNSVEAMTGETANAVKPVELPSVASQYGATKEILKTAAASDAQAQGTGKTDSQGKPIGNKPVDINLKAVTVRAKRFHEVGPLPGLGLTKDEIPGNVQSITAKEIKDSHSLSITDLMNKKLQSVNVNDYQGNPFMMDVTYRGFTAGPQIGTPQGLSVFFDGIRVNEPFGDVVNWDLIPMNALSSVDVFPGSNPIFGLGTLGGAFTVKTKDGFNNEGVDAEILTGSYGRKQLQISSGINNGTFALFGAGNFFLEDGWRDNSPSKVNQFFGKASYRGEKLDLNLSTLLVGTDLVGNGLLPSEQYRQDPSSVFTAPDTTKNKLIQFQLSGAFQASDTFSITGQVYNRKSDRKSKGADAYTRFSELDKSVLAAKNIDAGDEYTCLFASTNKYGLPDYYVVELPAVNGALTGDIFSLLSSSDPADPLHNLYLTNNQVKFAVDAFNGNVDLSLIAGTLNQALPTTNGFENFVEHAQQNFLINQNSRANNNFGKYPYPPAAPSLSDGTTPQYAYAETADVNSSFPSDPSNPVLLDIQGTPNRYYTDNGVGGYSTHVIITKPALNADKCATAHAKTDAQGNKFYTGRDSGGFLDYGYISNPDGSIITVPKVFDGAADQYGAGTVVQGVPTAVVTENEINQLVKGGAVQLNWNLDHHKFMVGASIDAASADYSNTQQLGFIDVQRNVFLDPAQALDVFALANGAKIPNNNFNGTSITKSLYASETWSPVETLHLTGALRYNDTKVKSSISERSAGIAYAEDLHKFTGDADDFNICPAANISPDGKSCTGIPTGFKIPNVARILNPAETEKFSYYSLNPSLGATWQATPNLNIFGNVAQGTRTPSVVELGCALNHKPPRDEFGQIAASALNRTCSLPSTLSGDPYLPQIKATTIDIGMRGTLVSALGMDNIEWNLGAYRTDLKDDIYLVAVAPGQDFFNTIGKTRRQGIEAGFAGSYGKAHFKLNYALTNATFEDSFKMTSENNSSASLIGLDAGSIVVKPGDQMPGVPLHNLNATLSYDVTSKWNIGLTAVAHSTSFVRGNENNEHQQGVVRTRQFDRVNPYTGEVSVITVVSQPTGNKGSVPGYATFNFQTSYKFNNEWTASMLVTNLLDKEYFSAGRLGINPFSPQIGNGPTDPNGSGFNHNSSEWLSTNFIAPSAPRGVWFSLNWQFNPRK